MPEYVIHIGPPKAGSKFLQTALYALRDELKQGGIYYSGDWQTPTNRINQAALMDQLNKPGDPKLKQLFGDLNASSYRYVVLSCEGFFAMTPEQLTALRGLVGGSPVGVVYYCRRWSERIPSLWQQNVKMGRFETLPEYYTRAVRNPRAGLDLNPSLIWDKFSNVFGHESLKLISLNNLIDSKTDLLDHFVDNILNWHYAKRPTAINANESPSMLDTEILRVLNYLHYKATGLTSDRIRVGYFDRKGEFDLTEIGEAIEADLGVIAFDDNAAPFRPIYKDMEKYQDRVLNPKPGGQIFEKKVRKFDYARQNYLLNSSIIETFHRIYAVIREHRQKTGHRNIAAGAAVVE